MVSCNEILFVDECQFESVLEFIEKILQIIGCLETVFEVHHSYLGQFFIRQVRSSVFDTLFFEFRFQFFVKRYERSDEFVAYFRIADPSHFKEGLWNNVACIGDLLIEFLLYQHIERCSNGNAWIDIE